VACSCALGVHDGTGCRGSCTPSNSPYGGTRIVSFYYFDVGMAKCSISH
jgi:hypothetical protein